MSKRVFFRWSARASDTPPSKFRQCQVANENKDDICTNTVVYYGYDFGYVFFLVGEGAGKETMLCARHQISRTQHIMSCQRIFLSCEIIRDNIKYIDNESCA